MYLCTVNPKASGLAVFLFVRCKKNALVCVRYSEVLDIKRRLIMVDIMSLTKMGGQVALTVTPEDLHHFANMLLAQSRKEWEEQFASANKEEPEETFLTTDEVCKVFNVCPATLWQWHRTGYLQHIKFGSKNMYPASAVKAITHARSQNETVSGYCKRTSKVEKNMAFLSETERKEEGHDK